jgi:hypothetical protein
VDTALTPGVSASTELTPQQKADQLHLKVHPLVFDLITRLRTTRGLNFGNFVIGGNAEVQVWLTDKSEATRMKLKELGFEVIVDYPNKSLMIGRLPMDKVEVLAQLKFVKYVSPLISK